MLCGRSNERAGHNLEPSTSAVEAVHIRGRANSRLVVVDTPGFDDTHKSDYEILQLIAEWLANTYVFFVITKSFFFLP
jgi:predicted GTPase